MIGIVKNVNVLKTLLCVIIFSQYANSQTTETCGQYQMTQRFYDEHPDLIPIIEQNRLKLEQHTAQDLAKSGVVYTVPVVVHVLHECGSENISDEQIHDGLRVLNEDFRKQNADISQVVSSFQGIADDAEIEFKLAQKDPNGNCTNGIDRILTSLTTNAHDNAKLNQWPQNKYLNIWVVKSIDNGGSGGITSGYAYFPFLAAADPSVDGIMIAHNYMGTIGTSNDDGRTLTHEAGHYLNIYHPWGNQGGIGDPNNCNDPNGDFVNDTPVTIGNNSSCNTASVTCGSLDNVQNYMDYASCTRMFTMGQVTRMRSAITSGTASRNNLWSSSNLTATGLDANHLCQGDFEVDYKNVCSGSTVNFSDASYNNPTTWNWSFSVGTPSSTSIENPSLTINANGYVDVTLTVGDGTNTVTETKNGFMRVHNGVGRYIPFSEDFEGSSIPNFTWERDGYPEDSKIWEQSFAAANSGSASIYLNNFGADIGSKDEFISETFDLSVLSAGFISFDYAYAQVTGSEQDRLEISISTDCGQTWNSRGVLLGSNMATATPKTSSFVPSSQEWANESVTLFTPDFDEGFAVKFTFYSEGGNNIYIDNIQIDGTFKADPVLHLPDDGALNVADNVTIDWKAVKNVDQYEYQIDVSPGFNSGGVITGTTNYIGVDPANSDTEFETSGLTHGQKYWWRVRSITGGSPSNWSNSWDFTVSANGVGIDEISASFTTSLYPNPSSESSVLEINLRRDETISVNIFNALGEHVTNLWQTKYLNAGLHNITIDTKLLKSGLYFITIENGHEEERLKLLKN
ncbi:MAG: M43 family zinc metalloprotease [Flavobacteriales bacterium]|nr:M43 family zinc metalloprotease [Flavobacteriales bacterium]